MSTWLSSRTLRWPLPRLKDVATVVNGFPFASEGFNDSVGTPIIRIRDLKLDTAVLFFDGAVPAEAMVHPGDLLVGMDGDFNSSTWRGPIAGLNQRMCKVVGGPSLDQRFLAYFIDLPLRAINDITYFTTVKHLSSIDLMNEHIPLPPLAEQRTIADYLDAETARIDALITKKQQLIHLLQERQSEASELAVIGATAKDLAKSRTGFFDLVESSWAETTLRHLRVQVQTGPFGSQLHAEEYVENGWPVINPANIRDGILRRIDSMTVSDVKRRQLARHILRCGDIVFGRRGEMGRAGLVSLDHEGWLCGTGSLRLRLDDSRMLPEYLTALLRTKALKRYFLLSSVGSTMDNLNSEILLSMPILLPPIGTQRRIMKQVIDIENWIASATVCFNKQLNLLKERRQALITAAVTGEFTVPGAP